MLWPQIFRGLSQFGSFDLPPEFVVLLDFLAAILGNYMHFFSFILVHQIDEVRVSLRGCMQCIIISVHRTHFCWCDKSPVVQELKRERAKAAAALAALQQKLEEKHILELEQKVQPDLFLLKVFSSVFCFLTSALAKVELTSLV